MPMTLIPEAGTVNLLYSIFLAPVSDTYVMWTLGADLSGTRFWRGLKHCSIPSQKVVSTWLKWSFMIYSFQKMESIYGASSGGCVMV